jgi:uncharacterized membrane protein
VDSECKPGPQELAPHEPAPAVPRAPRRDEGPPPDRTARVLGAILRTGVLTSAAIIVVGLLLFVHRRGAGLILVGPRGLPTGSNEDPSTVGELLGALGANEHVPAAVTDIGLLTLMVTPVVSVVVSLVAFARERDWTYVVSAGVVLLMLALGTMLGHI